MGDDEERDGGRLHPIATLSTEASYVYDINDDG